MGNDNDNISTRLTYLLIGGGIGAIIALLFAPKSGQELRGDLADATRKGIDRCRDCAGLARRSLTSGLGYLANFFRRLRINIRSFGGCLRIKFTGTLASRFVVLTGSIAKLLSRLA